jgi:hypothetical protein
MAVMTNGDEVRHCVRSAVALRFDVMQRLDWRASATFAYSASPLAHIPSEAIRKTAGYSPMVRTRPLSLIY